MLTEIDISLNLHYEASGGVVRVSEV